MRIYFGHSTGFDYRNELYDPIKRSSLSRDHDCVFPHDQDERTQRDRWFYDTIDLFVAEVSYPSTGLGIELAWTNDAERRIVCVHRIGTVPSPSISSVCDDVRTYADGEALVEIVQGAIASTISR